LSQILVFFSQNITNNILPKNFSSKLIKFLGQQPNEIFLELILNETAFKVKWIFSKKLKE